MKKIISKKKGFFLPVILLAGTLFLAYAAGLASFAFSNTKMAALHNNKITAMSIAEAGINYYMWHLAHSPEDFCDGQSCSGTGPYGPYSHDFKDQSGQEIGTYELLITPPTLGDATVLIHSTGRVKGTTPKKTIVAKLGMPSFTKYTLLVNGSELWVGSGESIDGSVFVNESGMRMDGSVSGDAIATEKTYQSTWGEKPGIWTHTDYLSTAFFGGDKSFPVPTIDFDQLDVDITNIRNEARDTNEGDYFNSSGLYGYHITLSESNYNICKVKNYESRSTRSNHLSITNEICTGTGLGIKPYPEKGVIFTEDNVWVEGSINNQRVTIIAADPEASSINQKKRIIIPNNIRYTNYDGSDKIGLITQSDILLTRQAPNQLEIDAGMIASEGEIKIENYTEVKNGGKIRLYGSMAHNTGLIWTYANGSTIVSGYPITETVMDKHNVLTPPPKFPKTGAYQILSWREE